MQTDDGDWVTTGGTSITGALFAVTLLMIVFRQRYPRWWFDFALELARFSARVTAYLALLTDRYPSTVEEQSVHLDIDYPDVERDLNRWLPLVKWFLVIPHFIILFFLWIGAFFAVVVAWFAILFTGRYPEGLFDYVVGVGRWSLRVYAYAFLLVTDRYPPFELVELDGDPTRSHDHPGDRRERSARWLSRLFGLADPVRFSVFWQVTTDDGVDLDFDTYGADAVFTTGHYAFLVDERSSTPSSDDFADDIEYWADPGRNESGTINRHDGGRGVYFASPDDHLFEIITVPYGGV